MQKRVNARQVLNPEEQKQIQFKLRCKFRALVRKVYHNKYWLEDVEDEELGEDVKKNILLLLRKKKGNKLLTLEDKGVLCKDASLRTKEEITVLFKKIGGFKCFRRYPNHVKFKLAGVSYFMYYPPGRVIVRQHQEAYSLYFIIEGEVAVIQHVFDPIKNEMTTVEKGTMGPGQLFGEVSLLHDIPRTATIKTLTHCEFLCLYRSDFNFILKNTLQKEWNRILNAMQAYRYFDDWDEVLRRECCIISKIAEYESDEIIYAENINNSSVHFLIEGSCRMIEAISVQVTKIGKTKHYKKLAADYNIKPIAKQHKRISNTLLSPRRSILKMKEESKDAIEKSFKIKVNRTPHMSAISLNATASRTKVSTETQNSIQKKTVSLDETELIKKIQAKFHKVPYDRKSKTIFMQVCLFHKLACFGVGEKVKNRCIVSMTPVKILQIPTYWILTQTKSNTWQRVEFTLNRLIPSSDEVFEKFLRDRLWLEYRHNMVLSIVPKRTTNNYRNVPLSIRIQQPAHGFYTEI